MSHDLHSARRVRFGHLARKPWLGLLLILLVGCDRNPSSKVVDEAPRPGAKPKPSIDALPAVVPADPHIRATMEAFNIEATYAPLEIVYPAEGTVFPPKIAPPTFRWRDDQTGSDTWLVIVRHQGGGDDLYATRQTSTWQPSADEWETIQRRSAKHPAEITVLGTTGAAPGTILSAGQVAITTSKDPVGASLFYREVNLPFIDAVKDPATIRWRFGDISSPSPPPIVLEGLPVCGNCHSFSSDGSAFGMDVDYANDRGSYVIAPVSEQIVLDKPNIITWSDFRREDKQNTFGLLSQVSPDGRYVVSTVKDRSVFVPRSELAFSQLFFPIKGILAVYCRETGAFSALPGADDPRFVHSNPTWSPDGKALVFARAEAISLTNVGDEKILLTEKECEEFLHGGRQYRFDLYQVPFNNGNGGRPQPLEGASANGCSNFFPKYSPDGKWIVFCKAESFMLLQPDSELFIIPAGGGEARRMRCNTPRMNSWHSWSPNGRWLVFSSKANGPYTQLWLTHVDDRGESTPPVVLEHMTASDRAANIPEFVNRPPNAIQAIREQFLDDHSYTRAGDEFLKAGDLAMAVEKYHQALKLNPANATARNNLGVIRMRQGDVHGARNHFMKALESNPEEADSHRNLGDALIRLGLQNDAMDQYRKTLQLRPAYAEARINLGLLLLMAGRVDDAVAELAEGVRQEPRQAMVRYHYARALKRRGDAEKAIAEYRQTILLAPEALPPLMDLALILAAGSDLQLRDGEEAVRLAKTACELTEYKTAQPLDVLAAAYAEAGQFSEAVKTAEQALQLARQSGEQDLARRIAARLHFYANSTPLPPNQP